MSRIPFPLARWNRLSFALGFLLLELAALSAKGSLGAAHFIGITIATLFVFTLCYWLEDFLLKRGSKLPLLAFQILFGLSFAGAVLYLFVKMISA